MRVEVLMAFILAILTDEYQHAVTKVRKERLNRSGRSRTFT